MVGRGYLEEVVQRLPSMVALGVEMVQRPMQELRSTVEVELRIPWIAERLPEVVLRLGPLAESHVEAVLGLLQMVQSMDEMVESHRRHRVSRGG
jgi:hypothetical protein